MDTAAVGGVVRGPKNNPGSFFRMAGDRAGSPKRQSKRKTETEILHLDKGGKIVKCLPLNPISELIMPHWLHKRRPRGKELELLRLRTASEHRVHTS